MNDRQRRELDALLAGQVHVHDEYSPLDGCGNRNQYSWAAVQAGQEFLGFTNHGRLGGALEHMHCCRHPEIYDHPFEADKKRAKSERLKPIMGIEAFFRRDRFMECKSTWAHHLCLHAASLAGWRTLLRLSSKSWVRRELGGGFYGKPCMDFEMLEDDHEDIIISTACLASPTSWMIMNGDDKGLKQVVKKLRRVSKNGIIWWEIMSHNLDDQRSLNMEIVNWANYFGDPIIGTSDVHIPFPDWELAHQATRMASYKQSFKHREAKKEAGEDVYTDAIDTVFLCSGSQMYEQFEKYHPDLPLDIVKESMANTHDFSRLVNWYVIGRSTKAPKVDVDAKEVVKKWTDEGFKRIFGTYPEDHWKQWKKEFYTIRRDYEFEVLDNKGVLPYFYIVGDFVRWAKSTNGLPALDSKGKVKRNARGEIVYEGTKRPIRIGLGRGSAAGCIISYAIGITGIDPISHKLKFERFLNPDRVGYPDIDMDIETDLIVITLDDGTTLDGRECIKEYLKRMYGHDHVVDIIAYQTFAPRVAIKEFGKVFDLNEHYLSEITESIGETDRNIAKLAEGNPEKGIEPNERLCELRDNNPKLWDVILKMEDSILRDTRHAGGVVITPFPTNFAVPTQIAADEKTVVTAWADRAEFPVMSDYGFLKYDILGVKSLAKQELACHLIAEHYGEEFEPLDLPALINPYAVKQEVIDAFVYGLTFGVFQFGGRQITNLLRHIKPESITDISIANALFRPGPIKIAFEYGDRKAGKVPITYWHDALEPILGETLGLMCFQEQAMEVAQEVGNFSGGQADALRKAMSKLYRLPGDKAQEYMQTYHEQWMKGTHENGIKEGDAEFIWIERFLPLGNYLFNRSHSSSYGLQAYQDMHIKTFYPLAFYAATLTVHKKSKKEEQIEWLRSGLREARIFEIEAATPDVNRSDKGWSIDGNRLRYGLTGITGMGAGLANEVTENRPFRSLDRFIEKMPSGFGADKIVALARAGAFDQIEDRKHLLSRTRQWEEGKVRINVKMSCGHLKTRTIKDVPPGADVVKLVKDVVDFIECPTHPDAEPIEHKILDDTYEVARAYKEKPGVDHSVIWEPTDDDLEEMEFEALNMSLTAGNVHLLYKPFIEARVFTPEEIEELPSQPKRQGRKHGMFCSCSRCEATNCVVGGEIVTIKEVKTRKTKELMAFVSLNFGVSNFEIPFFTNIYSKYRDLLHTTEPVFIACRKSERGSLIAIEAQLVTVVAEANGFDPHKTVSINKAKLAPKTKTRRRLKRKAVA